jgi:signal transduction histidine kinase
MTRAFSRLRWQLTLSHLVAITFTLICMIAAALLIVTFTATWRSSPRDEPAEDARTVARAAAGLVVRGDSADLNSVLRALADGGLRLPAVGGQAGPGPPWWANDVPSRAQPGLAGPGPPWWANDENSALRKVAYIVIVGPGGRVLGSSDRSGAAFAPPEAGEWRAIVTEAQAGDRKLGDLVVHRNGSGPIALGAYPVVDERGAPVAAAVVAKTALSQPGRVLGFWHALAVFGVATVAVLAAASVFALASSSLVAYLLSRRLVARLERLGRAAESLAAGDLSSRVDEGRPDEVGQLARQFNHMAGDLERTLRDLQAERDRVTGLMNARRQLVAGVSHELRTPVATVRGYLEAALGRVEALPAGLQTDLETMEREIARLQRLIEDLFALSRAEVGRLDLRLEPIDVGAVVRRLADTTAPLAWRQRRVQVLAEAGPDLPAARADAQRVEQIVSNLLSNAVRHTPPGGLVAATVIAEPDALRIEVRDTGEGIAPEDLPHVFERFYRRPDREGRGGAGLGLALVKELAEAMGGSVEAASTPGEGSCFAVRLPRVRAAASRPLVH